VTETLDEMDRRVGSRAEAGTRFSRLVLATDFIRPHVVDDPSRQKTSQTFLREHQGC
jgi:hypothetical protein